MDSATKDTLATKLAHAALTVLVRSCREQCKAASHDDLEAVSAAMQAKSAAVVYQLLDDIREAPWLTEAAFDVAVLDLASEGIRALQARLGTAAAQSPTDQNATLAPREDALIH